MQFFILYACCIPVKGHLRSIICDLQRRSFSYIPNGMLYILENFDHQSIEEIKEQFPREEHSTIDEYFQFLARLDFGFISDRPLPNLRKIDLAHYSPELITNAIVDIGKDSTHCYSSIATNLDTVRCKFLQLRFFSKVEASELDATLEAFQYSCLRSIYLVVADADYLSQEFLRELVERHLRVVHIMIHSSGREAFQLVDRNGKLTKVSIVSERIGSSDSCGEVSPCQFAVNLQAFSEAMHFNSCLYKKVGIDEKGDIRNCPSLKQSYGHISNTSINEVIKNPIFTEKWGITKDQINVCRDCEFRYICTDCRAFLQDASDPYSKPLKCGYNPYVGKWYDWNKVNLIKKGMNEVK